MAKTASELNRKVLQNIRTTKTNEFIKGELSATTALGEIAVQMGTGNTEEEKRINTGLWTLAADGEVAVRFPSEEWVKGQITSGASISVDNIIKVVGLENDGNLPENWNAGTEFISSSTTIINAITDLDSALTEASGNIETTIIALSGDVESTIIKLSGDVEDTILALSANVKDYVDTLSGNVHSTIDAMDKAADVQTGHIVTTVSQADGKVSETKALLTDVVLSGYSKTSDTGALAATDSVEVALSKLENNIAAAQEATTVASADNSINVTTGTTGTDINVNIKSGEHVLAKDGDAGLYTDIKLSAVTPSSTNVKEEYILKATDGTQLGESIKIYKDSAYKEIYLGTSADTINTTTGEITKQEGDKQSLNYAYMKDDGTYDLVKVDVSAFLSESEFKSGVTATNHIVHGVVDPQSEKDSQETPVNFLTVGADGFKVSGIKDEIDRKINALDASATGQTTDGRVVVAVGEADGKVSGVTVTLSDVASASALTQLSGSVIDEITRAKAAETALDGVVGSTKGANDETRTYGHSDTNYLDGNTTVKSDVEELDGIIGKVSNDPAGEYDVVFSDQNSVAKNISDIKKALDDYKQALTLTAVDDNKYIATEVVSGDTGTTIGVSAITMDITASTSGSSALADSYDVKEFAVSAVKDNSTNGGLTRIEVITEDDVKKLDVSNLTVDCGTF